MSAPGFELAAQVADAVLYEGYVLYPYRASAAKNRYRWQFGVLAPHAPGDDGEPSFAQTECVIAGAADPHAPPAALSVRVRCLRPRRAGRAAADDGPGPGATEWLEGVPFSFDADITLEQLPVSMALPLHDAGIAAQLTIDAEAAGPLTLLRVRVENLEPWIRAFDEDRDAMLQHSMVGTHVLLAVDNGRFESLVEPTDHARAVVERCRNLHTWPVLVGDRLQRNLMLSAPIVLYDFPAVATESHAPLCDATEIDEILTLRILTMTDEEKAEARATDDRAREILDRVESSGREARAALHGTMRSADFFNPAGTPAPEDAAITIAGQCVRRGSHVRLRPNRRADAMDMFFRDQTATVSGVYRDVDDRVYIAVTIDADPAASLHESFGRFFYFDPAELEPIAQGITRSEGRLDGE